MTRKSDLSQEGYTLDEATRVVRIRHEHSRDIDIRGTGGGPVPLIVDFDNPHVGANVPLRGQYPSGIIDWGQNQWKVCPPGGRMSTFSLCTADAKATAARFQFAYPKRLVGADIYNPTDSNIVVVMRAPEMREVVFNIGPSQLKRVKTGWRDRASSVSLESEDLSRIQIDNLAYSSILQVKLDEAE